METAKYITDKLKLLPDSPGVYIMKDNFENIIYVGKAVSLKNRVRQYFSSTVKEAKVSAMVAQIADFDYVMTASQKEALILECNLIKKYMPKYNILLKDDKHYPYIRIDINVDYPRVEVVRSIKEDGAKYFGPYTSAILIRDVLDTLGTTFKTRQCKKDILKAQKRKERPCLNFAINRCIAPCTGNVSKEEYKKLIKEIIDFLSGNGEELLSKLSLEMKDLSEKMEYEKCARIRDKIDGVRMMLQKQQATTPHLDDKDVFAITTDEGSAVVQAFFMRNGKLNETQSFTLTFSNESESEILSYFLLQYYISKTYIPREILVNKQIEYKDILNEWLSEKRGKRVYIKVPKTGDDKNLVQMAIKNANETLNIKLNHRQREYDKTVGAAKRLKAYLHLQDDIVRIECYDISNIQGTDSVSSMIVFTNGKPDKKEYRHFKIKTVLGANDFASMQETLERRFLRLLKEGNRGNFSSRPDLIVVDGGKGQLSAAYDALVSLGLENIPIIGLAKKNEEIFLPFEKTPLLIDKRDEALKLLQRVRDEAHRFAITYHRTLRQKNIKFSELSKIQGIGPKKTKALLAALKSIENIKSSTVEELSAVNGIDSANAKNIYEYFHAEAE